MSPKAWRSFPLSWKSWGDEVVVFNQASGTTHLINAVGFRILVALQDQPDSALGVSQRLAAESELETDEEIAQRVEILLQVLEDLGLIESIGQ